MGIVLACKKNTNTNKSMIHYIPIMNGLISQQYIHHPLEGMSTKLGATFSSYL